METLPPAHQTGKRDPTQYLIDTALRHAERGWRVFPLHNSTAELVSCASRDRSNIGKHVRSAKALYNGSTEVAMIHRMRLLQDEVVRRIMGAK